MTRQNTQREHSIDQLFAAAIQSCQCVARKLASGHPSAAQFGAVDDLLQALPLAQEEFGFARCRLNNARGYAAQRELNAAVWEIGLLVKRLQAESRRIGGAIGIPRAV